MLDSHQNRPGILINLPDNGFSEHGPMISLAFGLCGRLSLSVSCVLVVCIFTFIYNYNYVSIDSNAYFNICTVCIYMYICTCISCMYIHIHIYCTYAYVDKIFKYIYTPVQIDR